MRVLPTVVVVYTSTIRQEVVVVHIPALSAVVALLRGHNVCVGIAVMRKRRRKEHPFLSTFCSLQAKNAVKRLDTRESQTDFQA